MWLAALLGPRVASAPDFDAISNGTAQAPRISGGGTQREPFHMTASREHYTNPRGNQAFAAQWRGQDEVSS